MRPLLALLYLVFAAASSVFANPGAVELSYRLQPDRDLTIDSVADSITTLRVLEDRGIGAMSSGRLSSRPTTVQIIGTQRFRYITGSVQPDGSFSVEMRYLDKTTRLKGADGQEQLLPEKTPLKGLRVNATVEPGGKVSESSVALAGLEPSITEPLRQTMASILAQAASIQPIRLSHDRSVQQEMSMQIPLPSIATLNVKMHISNRLLAVTDGIAHIQQIYSMGFGTPTGGMMVTAEGSGGGTMLYEIATQILLSSETSTMMKVVLEVAGGVIEVQVNSKQSRKTRPTLAEAK